MQLLLQYIPRLLDDIPEYVREKTSILLDASSSSDPWERRDWCHDYLREYQPLAYHHDIWFSCARDIQAQISPDHLSCYDEHQNLDLFIVHDQALKWKRTTFPRANFSTAHHVRPRLDSPPQGVSSATSVSHCMRVSSKNYLLTPVLCQVFN